MLRYIQIGQIVNTHGHLGELKIFPLTDDYQRFDELSRIYIGENEDLRAYHIRKVRVHKGMVLITLKEIADMNQAEKLKGLYLQIPLEEVKPLPEGQYYIFQLLGLAVYNGDTLLGKVKDVLKTGSNDVYVVEPSTGQGKDILIPALKQVVTKIDLQNSRMEITPLPGLLE